MNTLNPRTVAESGEDISHSLGLTWHNDRKEIVRVLNLYRNMLYNRYQQFKLFDSVFHCICLQCFDDPCSKCPGKYCGITLPSDMAGVVSAWKMNEPIRTHSRWREMHTGRVDTGSWEGELKLYDTGQTFPTEREITDGPVKLKMFTEDHMDHGKEAFITIIDTENVKQKVKMKLEWDSWVTTPKGAKSIVEVSLPQLCGVVTLAQECGRELSLYTPEDRTPAYRRYKMTGNCACEGRILVQGTRLFRKVWFDTDIVEVSDMMILDLAGTYFRYWKSKDRAEREIAATTLNDIFTNLDGLLERHRGESVKDGAFPARKLNRTGLLYSRKHR